jgi:hypothetical protein
MTLQTGVTGGVVMRSDNAAAFGWVEDGKIRLRVGCKAHTRKARISTCQGRFGCTYMFVLRTV